MLFWDDWEELLKAHKYSRKEFVNGVMRYYYDKDDNFSRMTYCKAEPLAVSEAMTEEQVVEAGKNYIKNVWIADWKKKENKDKAVCRELRGKKICFGDISYEHIEKTGGHSSKGRGERSKENLLSHVKYLPLAKELLEENGVHTQSRYEELKRKTKDGAIAFVYQTVSGLAPEGDANNYVHVTVSQKKYADGHLGNTIYISVMGTKDIKKAVPQTVAFSLRIGDITEGNRQAKFEELQKCLGGEEPRYIADDGTRRLGSAELALKDLSAERVNKALRTMALSLDVPTKAGKGEAFAFKAQEDLSDKWAAIFASLVREAYDFVTDCLALPQVTIMSKAYLTRKGKILYSPETGEPIKQEEWNRFVKNLEDFLNRKTQGLGERIVLEGEALGAILDRMLKYNTLEAVKNARLEDLKYHGKAFDWIADNVKNLKNALGQPLTRREAARVQTIQMSAAQRITKMTVDMKEDVKQILIDGVKKRQGASQVSQALFDRFVGLNSNFQRIAETEIQNAVGGAIVREEVHGAKDGEKVYFQRVEIVDANTCPYCKRMEGKIAVWSDVPLANERVKDPHADFAIWEGKEWTGGQRIAAVGCFHPYCRGFWTRWTPEGRAADAYVAEIFKRGAKWKEAVETAKKEYREKGIENPDDRTAGYRERIEELFEGEKGAENG